MNWLWILFSIVPGIEARGAGLYLACSKNYLFIPFAVFLNFLSVMIFIRLLDSEKIPEKVEKFLEKKAGKHMKRAEKWFSKHGNLAIFFLIALPFTGIGSYTGAFIGRVFGLETRVFYGYVFLGILFSVLIGVIAGYWIGFTGIVC